MDRFNYMKSISEQVTNQPDYCSALYSYENLYRNSIVLDLDAAKRINKESGLYSAKVLKFATITSLGNIPDNILGVYMNEGEQLVRLKKVTRGAYVVYFEVLNDYINLTGNKAVQAMFDNVGYGNKIILSNDIYPREIMWSNTIKSTYFNRYSEDICDKLALLFIDCKGAARFRSRYFSLLSSIVRETFLDGLKIRAERLFAVIDCTIGAATQVLPNNSKMSFANIFDGIIVNYPAQVYLSDNLRRNIELIGNIQNRNIIAVIKKEDNENLSLNTVKQIIDRLVALGIEQICFEDAPKGLKYDSICEYLGYIKAAVSYGETIKDTLVVYPTHSAYADFNIIDGKKTIGFNRHVRDTLDKMCTAGLLCDIGCEQILQEAEIIGSTVKIGERTYDKIIVPDMNNISFATANFLNDFGKKGGKVHTFGKKVHLIDGVISPRTKNINKTVRLLDKIRVRLMKSGYSPLTSNGVDVRVMKLPDATYAYLISNITEQTGLHFARSLEIAKLDLVEKSEYQVGHFGLVELTAEYSSVLLHTVKGNTAKRNNRYINLEEEFTLSDIDHNILPLVNCKWRIKGGEWQQECKIAEAVSNLAAQKGTTGGEFAFTFFITDKEDINFKLNFIGSDEYNITFNSKKVKDEDITKFVTLGENTLVVSGNKCELFGVYISGKFAVQSNSNYFYGEDNSVITKDDFYITSLPETVPISKITENGFWFFDSVMTLTQTVDIGKKLRGIYKLGFKRMFCQLVGININTIPAGTIAYSPYEKDISDFVFEGINEITLTIYADKKNKNARDYKFKNAIVCEKLGCSLRPKTEEIIHFEDESLKNVNKNNNKFTVREGEVAVFSVSNEKVAKLVLENIVSPKIQAKDNSKIERVHNLVRQKLIRRNDISVLTMDCTLMQNLTIKQNVAVTKKASSTTLQGVIETVGISHISEMYPKDISAEDARLAMLGAAVYGGAKIIICDLCNIQSDNPIFDVLAQICKNYEKTAVVITRGMTSCDKADRFTVIEETEAEK